jgi:protein PhnA
VFEKEVTSRANGVCEICGSDHSLAVYAVPSSPTESADSSILTCGTCRDQLTEAADLDINHWRCLNDAMWSPVPAVQVVAWRMLNKISSETWAQDLLDMMYLDEDLLSWASAGAEDDDSEPTLDSNGDLLQAGDTVHLIKDLNVKGANFTAKRGTPVRNIRLTNNPLHIEGKVNGQQIVIIAAYTKKS